MKEQDGLSIPLIYQNKFTTTDTKLLTKIPPHPPLPFTPPLFGLESGGSGRRGVTSPPALSHFDAAKEGCCVT